MVTDHVEELFEIIKDGLSNLVDLIIELPTLLYSLINLIPMPFYDIVKYFLSFFIILIFIFAINKIIGVIMK